MKQNASNRYRVRARGVVALVAMLATVLVTAAPAGAATRCVFAPDSGGLVVQVDETNPGDVTDLAVRNGELFVNGDSCGTGNSITIIDLGDPKVDNLRIDLGPGPFRADGEALFVTLILDEAPANQADEVLIRGTRQVDHATLMRNFVFVSAPENFPGSDNGLRLIMGTQFSPGVKLKFALRGGDDTFQMLADNSGAFHRGFVRVAGGAGADVLLGGPGRQRILGGGGPDIVEGFAGNDLLWGNRGDDFIDGGRGADRIDAGGGEDVVRAGPGRDVIDAEDRDVDDVFGGAGPDVCDCDRNDIVGSARRR